MAEKIFSIRSYLSNIANMECFSQVSFIEQFIHACGEKSAVQFIRCGLSNIANKDCFFRVSFVQKVIRACGEKICGVILKFGVLSFLWADVSCFLSNFYVARVLSFLCV